jgi:hypothetical protein
MSTGSRTREACNKRYSYHCSSRRGGNNASKKVVKEVIAGNLPSLAKDVMPTE